MNVRVLKNVQKYERLLVDSPPLLSTGLKRPNTTYLRTRNTYERLCRTQGTQPTHYENPRLFCDYFNNDSPGLLLQPIRREVLSLQPYVVLYHSFITDSEAESIRDLAQTGVSVYLLPWYQPFYSEKAYQAQYVSNASDKKC
uniref:Uncharacterized protein n=1 Tax=Hucho hucho TaxID=62062 RepID=A0A4W5NIH3_9TELE